MTCLTLAFFTLASTIANRPVDDAYALQWMPTKGQTLNVSMEIRGMEGGQPLSIDAAVKQTVDSVSKEGYQMTSESLGALVRIGGQEIRDDRKTKTVVKYFPNGAVKEFGKTDDKGESMRVAVATRFVAPSVPTKVGDGWLYVYPEKGDFPGARMSFSLKSVGDGIATVTFIFGSDRRERPYVGRGTWKIDAKTGLWISLEATIEAWLDGGKAPGTIKMTHS
ncbi:MAG: hypothetical protein KF824_08495 [Fimbriimonadaceae bacterium]|nr:MAG: hypothetical protein KF824_08495 [Fimbriimonadaceae bacterium]